LGTLRRILSLLPTRLFYTADFAVNNLSSGAAGLTASSVIHLGAEFFQSSGSPSHSLSELEVGTGAPRARSFRCCRAKRSILSTLQGCSAGSRHD
jgi:hypothetical protein